jgi:hypothetical protein
MKVVSSIQPTHDERYASRERPGPAGLSFGQRRCVADEDVAFTGYHAQQGCTAGVLSHDGRRGGTGGGRSR